MVSVTPDDHVRDAIWMRYGMRFAHDAGGTDRVGRGAGAAPVRRAAAIDSISIFASSVPSSGDHRILS
jgi:hypothetical protein